MDSPDDVCEPCQYRHVHTPASIYCNTCRESYCKSCADVHRASKIGRSHFLVGTENENVKETTLGKDLENSQSCKSHSNKYMEFYCSDHSAFICTMCLLTSKKHKKCKHIFEILSAGKALIKNKFMMKINQYLQEIADQAEQKNETANKASVRSKEEFDNLNTQIDGFVEKIDTVVTSLKLQAVGIKHDMAVKYDKQQTEVESSQHEVRALVTSIESCQILFDTVLKTGSPADTFRCIVSMVGQYNAFKAKAQQMKIAIPLVKVAVGTDSLLQKMEYFAHMPEIKMDIIEEDTPAFSFTKDLNSEFQSSLSTSVLENINTSIGIQQFGAETECVDGRKKDVSETAAQGKDTREPDKCKKKCDVIDTSSNRQPIQQQPEEDGTIQKSQESLQKYKTEGDESEINVEFDRVIKIEKTDANFKGIVTLPDGRIVLSDSKKSRLLILSSNAVIQVEIPLTCVPETMTTLAGKYLVVCVRNTKLLLVLEIDNMRKVKAKLETRFHPKCVQAINSLRMLVSMKDARGNWYLDVMTINGAVTQRIKLDRFYDGYNIAVQHVSDNNYIINCCDYNGTIRRFGMTGQQLHTEPIANVSRVMADQLGFVYAIQQDGNIKVYSPNLATSKIFIGPLRGDSYATFNATFDRIYMLLYKAKMIVVMNVSRTKI